MFSVVIPAHNEGAVITRCLEAVTTGLNEDVQIAVVCNGCSDNTAELARAFKQVEVYELDIPSKVNAINFAELQVSAFPRIYVDSDLIITGAELERIASYLRNEGVMAVAPRMIIDESRSSWSVKAYHRVWKRLPYYASRLGGVFGLSEQARSRFHHFPQIIADDAFVRAQFSQDERLVPDDCSFTAIAPFNLRDLIKIKTRSRFGNVELKEKFPELAYAQDNTSGSLVGLIVKSPWLLPSIFVYVYVNFRIQLGVRKRLRNRDYSTWERDESSRPKS